MKNKKDKKEWEIRLKSKKWFGSLLRRRMLIIVILLFQIVFIIYSLLSSSEASNIVRNSLTVISFAVALHVVAADSNRGAYKLTWVLLILLFPVFGGLLYLLVSFQSSTKRFRKIIILSENKAKEYQSLIENGYNEALEQIPE